MIVVWLLYAVALGQVSAHILLPDLKCGRSSESSSEEISGKIPDNSHGHESHSGEHDHHKSHESSNESDGGSDDKSHDKSHKHSDESGGDSHDKSHEKPHKNSDESGGDSHDKSHEKPHKNSDESGGDSHDKSHEKSHESGGGSHEKSHESGGSSDGSSDEKPGGDGKHNSHEHGGKSGENPGGISGEKPGGNSGEKPGGNSGEKPGGNSGEKPGANSGEKPGGNSGEKPGGNSGEKPGGNSGENPGGDGNHNSHEHGGKSGENPGGNSAEKPGGNSGEKPGGNSGEKPGGNSGENPGGNSGEKPGGDGNHNSHESDGDSSDDSHDSSDDTSGDGSGKVSYGKYKVIYEWHYMDYMFANESQRKEAIESGAYDYKSSVPIDVDVWADMTFVTVVRTKGVPSSLNYVSAKDSSSDAKLIPYPDWSWTNLNDCNSIISVYRVTIDHCGRLWVLDTGVVDDKRICLPKLLVFNLWTNQLIKKVEIPDDVARNAKTGNGLLVTPAVLTSYDCSEDRVYIADVEGYGLIIYDGVNIWRLDGEVFAYEKDQTFFTIAGESFTLYDGILGIAVKEQLVIKALAATSSYTVALSDLTYEKRNSRILFTKYENFSSSQSGPLAIASNGALLYAPVENYSVMCRNSKNIAGGETLLLQNEELFQFVSGMKIIPKLRSGKEEEVLMISNRFQKVMNNDLNQSEVNFRVYRANVNELTANTACSDHPAKCD